MQDPDPFARFETLFQKAWKAGVKNAHAMTLSTVDADGQPSSRQVLLKGNDERGFVFYTNFESRKGTEIAANPRVSLNFYWRELDEQVTVLGNCEQVSSAEADVYFDSRDRGSQLGAWASRQSRPVESRAALLEEVAKVQARYGDDIPRPPHWSGYRVVPFHFDFWKSGEFRLHDRWIYHLGDDGHWTYERISP